MTKNGLLTGWVREEGGRSAYYDVYGSRYYRGNSSKPKTTTNIGEVTVPNSTYKVLVARSSLPLLVGGESKFKLQPVWHEGKICAWERRRSGVSRYYDLSGQSIGQDEITIATTMPPWEIATMAAGGVKLAATGVAKGVGALFAGGVRTGGKNLDELLGGALKDTTSTLKRVRSAPVIGNGGKAYRSWTRTNTKVGQLPRFSGRKRRFVERKLREHGFRQDPSRPDHWYATDGSRVRINRGHAEPGQGPFRSDNEIHFHKEWIDKSGKIHKLDDLGRVNADPNRVHIIAKREK
jgi:hypothetical protein